MGILDFFLDTRMGRFIGTGILAAAIITFYSYLTFLFWNALMPEVFGLPTLTFWESFLLWVLVNGLTTSPT